MLAHQVLINRMNMMQNAMRAFERRDRRKKAATLIQCGIRCAIARRRRLKLQTEKDTRETNAALRLQYRLRAMIAMKMMKLLRKKVAAELSQKREGMTDAQRLQRWKDEKEEALKHDLQTGDSVTCRWMGKDKRYPGTVMRINPAGDWLEGTSYEILYYDGFLERRAKRTWIRFVSRPVVDSDEEEAREKAEAEAAAAAAEFKRTGGLVDPSALEDGDKKKKTMLTDGDAAEGAAGEEGGEGDAEKTTEGEQKDGQEKEQKKKKKKKTKKKKKEKERIDPIEAQFSVLDDYHAKMTTAERIRSYVPFTRAFFTRRKKNNTKTHITANKGRHTVYAKQRTSAKIRVGVDDIKIVLGELANMTMEAKQRSNARAKRLVYIKIDIDLRQQIRFQTNDDLCVYVWYRRSTNPRLVCDIKVGHGWTEGHEQWAQLRELGYEKVESNVDDNTPEPTHWTRLPMVIWIKKDVYATPIEHLMFSRRTTTRAQEIALMKDGYSPIPQDLKMFGLDHGLQFWWRRMEKFDDEIEHLQRVKTKLNRTIRALHDVPPDLDPRQLAVEAGAKEAGLDALEEVIDYLNLTDKEVRRLNTRFCKLAHAKLNPDDVRLSLDELIHALGFEYGAKELGTVMRDITELAHVELIDGRFLNFLNYLRLLRTWCVMEPDHLVRFFFNIIDTKKEGYVPMLQMRSLILELHNESNAYRQRNIHKTLKKSFVDKNFAPDGSGKLSFKQFRRCHVMLPQLLYPLFNFQYKLSLVSGGQAFWEKKKEYFRLQRAKVAREFKKANDDLEKARMAQFAGALSHAVMKDTVAALLAGKDPPPDASAECIKEASRRVKKIQAKAGRLKLTIKVDGGKGKGTPDRRADPDDGGDASSGDED